MRDKLDAVYRATLFGKIRIEVSGWAMLIIGAGAVILVFK